MKRDRASEFDAGNQRAAGVILSDPEAHPAGLVQWARAWQAGHPQVARRWEKQAAAQQDGGQMALGFGQREPNACK